MPLGPSSPGFAWPLLLPLGTGEVRWVSEQRWLRSLHLTHLALGETHMTVLGKMALIRGVLPTGPYYSTAIRPGPIELSRQQPGLAVFFPYTLKVLCL